MGHGIGRATAHDIGRDTVLHCDGHNIGMGTVLRGTRYWVGHGIGRATILGGARY